MMLIRLTCIECDRRDHDGITDISPSWHDVEPSNAVDHLLEKVTGTPVTPHWSTHMGVCPDCQHKRREEIAAINAGLK